MYRAFLGVAFAVGLAAPMAAAQEVDGCPAGTFETLLTPDGATLTILFDSFVVELADGDGTTRATCNLHIPLPLPPNTSIGVYKVDYRGFAYLAAQQQFEFEITYGFNDGRDHSYRRQIRGTADENFALSQTIGAGLMRRVGCGASAALDIHAVIALDARGRPGQAYAGLDTYDGTPRGGLVYQFQLRPCGRQQ
ncbi:MAG: DUF4360 domain-containing protein [Bauldia sp.]|nr:DUF4360 domain-containing protein [Bauldia sp.]